MDKDKFGDHGILGIKLASQEMILTIFPWFSYPEDRHRPCLACGRDQVRLGKPDLPGIEIVCVCRGVK
jgi:hypothetical protein